MTTVFFPFLDLFERLRSRRPRVPHLPLTTMSSSSATGASSRSPSPATPEAEDLSHVLIPGEEYPWLSSSPVSRSSAWDAKPEQYADVQKAVPALSLQDLLHDSALEEYDGYARL
jgi:hypothetical protein